MSDQPTQAEETVAIPPKKSGGGNKVLYIILGVVLFCIIAFGAVMAAGVFYVANRGADIVQDVAKTQGIDIENFDADSGTGSVSIKTDKGEMVTTVSKELPDDYPVNELPVYDALILTTNRMSMSDTKIWSLVLETPDSMDTVGDAIKADLEENGWKVVAERDGDESSIKTATKGDYFASIGYSMDTNDADQKVTRITYSLRKKGKTE